MSIAFRCPECQEEVKVSPTLAGMHSACPNCYVSVTVPAVAVSANKDTDDRPRTEIHARGDVLFHLAPPKDRLEPAWRWVMTGLASIFAGGMMWLLIVALVGTAFFTRSIENRFTSFPVISALLSSTASRAIDFLLPACGFLFLAGWALCLAVPRGAQARRWVVAGGIGILFGALVDVAHALTSHRQREAMGASDLTLERLDIALGVIVLLTHLVLVLFLHAVTRALEEPLLSRQCVYLGLGFTAFAIIVSILDAIAGGKGLHLVGTAGYVLFFGGLQYLVARTAWQIWRGL